MILIFLSCCSKYLSQGYGGLRASLWKEFSFQGILDKINSFSFKENGEFQAPRHKVQLGEIVGSHALCFCRSNMCFFQSG